MRRRKARFIVDLQAMNGGVVAVVRHEIGDDAFWRRHADYGVVGVHVLRIAVRMVSVAWP